MRTDPVPTGYEVILALNGDLFAAGWRVEEVTVGNGRTIPTAGWNPWPSASRSTFTR